MKRYESREAQLFSIPGFFDGKHYLYCGANKDYHRYIPEITKWINPYLDVVEVVPKHQRWCKDSGYFHNVYCQDIIDFIPPKQYDVILMLHIIEHLSLEHALEVVGRFKQYTNLLIIAVPWGNVPSMPSGRKVEFPSDNHITQWQAGELGRVFKLHDSSVTGQKDIPGNQILGWWRR